MVKPQFRQLDVESMGRLLYGKKERKPRKQKLAQLKRQREREEQQQPRSLLPPTPPDALEPDIGNLGATDAQIIKYTSGAFLNFPGCNFSFNFFENLDMADIAHTIESLTSPSEMDDITTVTTGSFSPNKIQPHPKLYSPHTPLLGHPTEHTSREEANPLLEELPVSPSLVRRATGQIRPTSSVLSDRNTVVSEDKEMRKSGETRKSCDADGSAADEISSSDDDDTHGETCTEELAVPGPKPTVQNSSGIPASQILSKSNSAPPKSIGSPPSATSSTSSFSIDTSASPLNRVEGPKTDVALPTSSFDHASVSRQGGDAIIRRGKRGCGAIEDSCESHGHRSPKRRRSQDANSGTASPAPPARTLRALPSRQRQQPPIMTEITSHFLDHSSGKTGLESSNQVPSPPVATTVRLSPVACHTCGFSAEHLLRMSDTVQALAGSVTDLSDSRKGLDMLHLFIGLIRDYATRLQRNATSTGKGDPGGIMNPDYAVEAVIRPSNGEIVENDESSDNSDGDGDGDSESESDSGSSDHSDSPYIPHEKVKRPQRLRWTPLDELRLRAWVQEEKEWLWIAGNLKRSEQAVIQHWKIMGKQDKGRGKK
ncbi:hypothetical protein CCHR01_18694 [Colletotrichum chrysophilum]|uniref:Myb-like domain-containing protein n=1 Tax=Colletotrichum chrysophilum TaxID=1836956 RepID=A0AAD9EB78_9PEZI|nr:hypothetical protein CCHR01_18694 [Colletotrichum chrysophilum]